MSPRLRSGEFVHMSCLIYIIVIHSFISDIYIAPLQDFYSEALPTTARTLNRSFTPKRMSNCELRTCPGSLRGGLRWIRTRNPPAARHQIYPLRWIRTRNPPAARHRTYLYTTAYSIGLACTLSFGLYSIGLACTLSVWLLLHRCGLYSSGLACTISVWLLPCGFGLYSIGLACTL